MLGLAAGAVAQQLQPPSSQGFPTADAAAEALADAVRDNDSKAIAAMWGANWRDFVPGTDDDVQTPARRFLKAWDESHKVVVSGDAKADDRGRQDRLDAADPDRQGRRGVALRRRGRPEGDACSAASATTRLAVIQTLLAIVDAQSDYAALDPMKTGAPSYARRLLSSPGKKDGLYWEAKPGEPQSPLGPAVAKAQADGQSPDGHYGYYFRLLYAQGAAAPGGARDYVVNGRMIGGFGVIAWPVRYGDTGVMTFIVNQDGVVYQQDLGPQTAEKAGVIASFNPDKGWVKADMTPP